MWDGGSLPARKFDEIMRFGHVPSHRIPERPAAAEFPEQPWTSLVKIQVKRSRSMWSFTDPFKNQDIEIGADEPLEAIWGRLKQVESWPPELRQVVLTPRSTNMEMKVTIPKRYLLVVIGAVINGNWEQRRMRIDWLRSPEKVLRDCARICAWPASTRVANSDPGFASVKSEIAEGVSATNRFSSSKTTEERELPADFRFG
jgi:hypothetical protein